MECMKCGKEATLEKMKSRNAVRYVCKYCGWKGIARSDRDI